MQQQQVRGDFNKATRESILRQPPITYQSGQPTRVQLPNTGFLGFIYLMVTGTTTTAAASSTTAEDYIAPPVGIVRRIVVKNNQGVELWNTSGWGAYLHASTTRTGFDPLIDKADYLGGFISPFTRYFVPATSLGASASENWRFALRIPIAWSDNLQAGLQLMQDPAIQYTVEITWGDATDLYSATTGTVTLSNIQALPVVQLFHVPVDTKDLPSLNYTKTVLEDVTSINSTGDFTYKVVPGNMLTKIIQEFTNTAAGNRTPIPAASMTGFKVRYSQTQIPYDIDGDTQCFIQRYRYGRDLPVGTYCYDFSIPNGMPELPGSRDIINTARLTDLDIISTLSSGLTLVSAQARTIREQLVPNR